MVIMRNKNEGQYDINITADRKLFSLDFKEIWKYRDLIKLWIRRDWIANYKQTILGPMWAIVNPIASTIIYTFVFGRVAGLSPSGIPMFLFYMSGQMLWNYFSNCLNGTTNTFLNHSYIMSKVYFPRIIMPIVTILSNLISFLIQFGLFVVFYLIFMASGNALTPQWTILLLPLIVFHLGLLALGAGIILSALTTKYRDLYMLVGYGVTLWMYLTPILYDISFIPEKYYYFYMFNPVTPIILLMRHAFFGEALPNMIYYLVSIISTTLILWIGIKVFSKVERTFVDTI